ncbi:unnamed protein product [Paramecium primaurelia]|uniref:ABC3 transporter permease C-terminal domain-containing protein n=1 Tax=Paramecium primaurelia TaxID=5886 RepID=A0A8S1PES8_PARPR|nr:unnamed protein product [Paramecium primaurelia]
MQPQPIKRKDSIAPQGTSMSICSSLLFMIGQSCYEIKRRPCGYCVSFFSVLIVVAASAVSQSIIDRAPLIFLKSAEGPAGQSDIVLMANPNYLSEEHEKSPQYLMSIYSNSARQQGYLIVDFLNFTRVKEVLGPDRADQASPRIEQQVNFTYLQKTGECENSVNKAQQLLSKRQEFGSEAHFNDLRDGQQLGQRCGGVQPHPNAKFVAIDTQKEKKIGLGWEYPFDELKETEVIMSRKLAETYKLNVGDYMLIYGEFYDFYASYYIENYYEQIGKQFNLTNYNDTFINQEFSDLKKATQRFYLYQVKGLLDSTYGKFPDGDADKLIIVEHKHLFNNLAYWSWDKPFLKAMYTANPEDFVDEIRINIPDRFNIYMDSNYENIQGKITKYASNIRRDLGVYPCNMDLPVLQQLYDSRFGQLFLGIILNMIIVILFLLSVLLLYTLLLISVETKTYDLGVLRVLGFNKLGVVFMVLIQALSYVLPAIIVGIILSIPFLLYASSALKASIGVEIEATPTTNAIFMSLGLGLLIPLLSSYVPIKEALSKQLSFALDINRSKSTAVKIEVDLEGKSLPWGRIQFAIIASLFGICVYYFLPLALLSFNIGLLLSIFFFILCGMLLGLVIFAFNIQYLAERFTVYIFLFWASSAKKTMVLKNLAAHRIKNRRTALMYALSIAFVIFIFVGMSVQIENQATQTLQQHGCKLEITSSNGYLSPFEFENIILELGGNITSFAWVTDSLDSYMQRLGFSTAYMTHLGQVYQLRPKIVGVSHTLFDMGYNQFLKVEDQINSKLNPVEQLYTSRGSQSAIIGTSYADQLNIKIDIDSTFLLIVYNNTFSQYHQMRASSIITSAPALKFSSLPSVQEQNVVVSLPTFRRLCGNLIDAVENYPMKRLLISVSNSGNIDTVYGNFKKYIDSKGVSAKIWDYRDYETSIKQSQDLIQIIFSFLTGVVMVLSFFSLMTSMTANMLEQVKEISVLRAIGNTKMSITIVYIMEAFTLVFSSSFIGLMVGFIIGQSMALQQTLFTQLPLIFVFPWQMLIIIIIIAMIAAIISVVTPSLQILSKEIAQIMRMI